jgi:hypothetical protein
MHKSIPVGTNVFVFVVCGASEHIETLHFSIAALKRYSKYPIWVVTDSARNKIPIKADIVLQRETPSWMNDHQASIYLKTSLHRQLPAGNCYCYLDSDVIALNSEVDNVFKQKKGLIAFAPDHSRMSKFSPYAVKCGCLEQNQEEWCEIHALIDKEEPERKITDSLQLKKQQLLRGQLELIKHNKLWLISFLVRYILSRRYVNFSKLDFVFDKKKAAWVDENEVPVMFELAKPTIAAIEQKTSWRWNSIKRRWRSPSGRDVHNLHCGHLQEKIKNKFGIEVASQNWQHWNGGVFVFDDGSHEFLEAWHQKTMQIFGDSEWRTRDQGTLIATAWGFGFQHMPLISKKYNFITDPSNPGLMVSRDGKSITDDAFSTEYSPSFVHVFHGFGNKNWTIWNWIEQQLST